MFLPSQNVKKPTLLLYGGKVHYPSRGVHQSTMLDNSAPLPQRRREYNYSKSMLRGGTMACKILMSVDFVLQAELQPGNVVWSTAL